MSNFLNGHDASEAAALNSTSKDLGDIVKRLLASSVNLGELVEIVDSDLPELNKKW